MNCRAAIIALAALTALPVMAQNYPTRPIKLVVPFAPGGGSDAMARAISTDLAQSLGQPVVVDNRPGAAGTLATGQVAKSPADGYTLLLADVPFVANLAVYSKPGYKLADFAPVATVAEVPSLLVVNEKVPANSVKELIAYAKSKPGVLNMASGGAGGVAHLQGEQFAHLTGIWWVHVPYKGMAPAAMDVVGGQADLMFASAPTVVGHLKESRLKALAVTSRTRSPLAPNIPTMAEQGFPSLTTDNWFGILAPAGTPPSTVALLNAKVNAALKTEAVQKLLQMQMATPLVSTSEQFSQLLGKDAAKWATIVKDLKIEPN